MGLGLPTARNVIERHGGTLTVESNVGQGTSFRLSLPAQGGRREAQQEPDRAAGAGPSSELTGRGEGWFVCSS